MVDFRINVIINPVGAVAGAKRVDAALTRTAAKAGLLRGALLRALAPIATGVFLVTGIKTLANFGQAMSTVAAITDATGDSFQELREKAIALGRDTRFSATEAADGMTFLARAGFDANEVLAAIGPTLDLAVAGNLDLARAADISSNVLKGFRLPVSEMGRVLDVMALATNRSNTNVSQLGDAMKFVAPIAAGLGVSVEETAAAVGALSDAGLQASLAGTGLRKVLGELEAPSDKSKRIFQGLGLSFEEVQVSEVGLTASLERLKKAGVTTANALQLFGQRGGPAFEVLVNSIPAVRELNEELLGAAGSTKKMADIMDDNLLGALRRIRSAFQTLVIRLGDSGATGALRSAFESLASGMRFLAKNIDLLIDAIQGIVFVVAVRQVVALTIALRAMALAALANPYVALAKAILLVGGGLIAFRKQIKLSEGSTTTLGDVGKAAFDKISTVVESWVPLFKEVTEKIAGFFGVTFEGFEFDLENVLLAIAAFADTAVGLFNALGNTLVTFFTGLPRVVGEFIVNVGIEILQFMKDKVSGETIALLVALGVTIRGMGQDIFRFFSDLNLATTQLLQGNAAAALETAGQASDLLAKRALGIGKTFSDILKANILKEANDPGFVNKLSNPFEGAGEDMAAALNKGFEDGLSFSGFTDFILETLTAANAAAEQREALAAQAAAQAAANEETAKAVALQAALAGGTNKATASIGSMSESLSGGFKAGLQSGLAGATDVAGAMENTVVNAFGAAEDALVSFVTTGKVDFAGLVDGILADLTRLLAKMLLLNIINNQTGGAAGGGGAEGIAALLGLGEKAEGGPVRPGEPVIVGERGPELFIPPGVGSIAAAAATAAAGGGQTVVQAPPVNVSVINVTDPKEVLSSINSAEGEQVIMNIITKNRSTIKNNLAG